MKAHTNEPWEAFSECPGECCWHIRQVGTDSPFDQITNPELSEEDAKRIVACVNACKGIPTETLIEEGLPPTFNVTPSEISADLELLSMWNVIVKRMFKPELLPPRGDKGYTWHPDLDFFFRKFPEVDDEGFAAASFLECLGFEFASVFMSGDVSSETFQNNKNIELTEDISHWNPSWPEGENWLQAAITTSDLGPVAIYIRLPGVAA